MVLKKYNHESKFKPNLIKAVNTYRFILQSHTKFDKIVFQIYVHESDLKKSLQKVVYRDKVEDQISNQTQNCLKRYNHG